ncbi:hypothetical protein V5799_030259 [Amblyomma americanum]|uniref:Uncharacterized protein n=2 Tax=Amblyomma americanum TaxID=6943 RepID=A0AAQ4ENQ8_AMBAM
MFSKLKESFEDQLRHQRSWLDDLSRRSALAKLAAMRLLNGFPHGVSTERDMNDRFAEFPEMPDGASFWDAWLTAARIAQRRLLTGNLSDVAFVSGRAIAIYATRLNLVVLPAGIIGRPVFYKLGPPAHNYGALGMVGRCHGDTGRNSGS